MASLMSDLILAYLLVMPLVVHGASTINTLLISLDTALTHNPAKDYGLIQSYKANNVDKQNLLKATACKNLSCWGGMVEAENCDSVACVNVVATRRQMRE